MTSNNHPLVDTSDLQRDLLAIVAREGPANGVELRQHLAAVRGESLSQRYFYQQLNGLGELGLIQKEPVSGSENRYEISEDGWEALHEYARWLQGR